MKEKEQILAEMERNFSNTIYDRQFKWLFSELRKAWERERILMGGVESIEKL